MGAFFGSVWWLIVALGLLVTFHEFGHYWVARKCGVKVLRFSVGFGRPLWKRIGRDGTEWVIAAIPLGGYVKMLDEREGPVSDADLDEAFNRKSLGQRTAIVAAGPIANLLFAFLAFWLMFMLGVLDVRALLGETTGLAAQAGLKSGDEIVMVEDETIETWSHANLALLPRGLDRSPTRLTVEDKSGQRREVVLDLSKLPAEFDEESLLDVAGLKSWQPRLEPIIGSLDDGGAKRAGLIAGDEIVSINGDPISRWSDLSAVIQKHSQSGQALRVSYIRDEIPQDVLVSPEQVTSDGEVRYVLGIRPQEPSAETRAQADRFYTVNQYGPIEAIQASLMENYRITSATLSLLTRMLTGSASLKNLSGPISIARYARYSAELGLSRFLFFLGVLSLSLAILNFLPVPLLDGGHLLYYFVEWVKGSPVSERTQIIGQYIGLAALAGLVSITFYNDILRLMQL